ncbi:hypothetical protein NDU88_004935 [Pleurodeles waltl]|uniref:Uncharacterized protein n=1 Tax=Pleurodeles waltl TaxID=8319 RepID=A0AAV7WA20_PLEWA|nr:hypothetical protein NDU88_004935 [Pleurodeles waltl]
MPGSILPACSGIPPRSGSPVERSPFCPKPRRPRAQRTHRPALTFCMGGAGCLLEHPQSGRPLHVPPQGSPTPRSLSPAPRSSSTRQDSPELPAQFLPGRRISVPPDGPAASKCPKEARAEGEPGLLRPSPSGAKTRERRGERARPLATPAAPTAMRLRPHSCAPAVPSDPRPSDVRLSP